MTAPTPNEGEGKKPIGLLGLPLFLTLNVGGGLRSVKAEEEEG